MLLNAHYKQYYLVNQTWELYERKSKLQQINITAQRIKSTKEVV
jgi:hypothetical protein